MNRRRTRGHANHDRWLVSYADFITLLFAFFVVLYSSAQVDQRKVGRLAVAIQVAFQQLGVFPAAGVPIQLPANPELPLQAVTVIEANQQIELRRTPLAADDNADPDSSENDTDLTLLQSELQQALQQEIAAHAVALHRETDGLVISLREFGFFDSGSVTIKSAALPALDRIASLLAIRTCRLRIEGHTDNVPIHTSQISSNWELSTARATELVRLLIQRYRFSPERLSAAGYAEYHPIASNATEQGRAQNRRVDLVILSEHLAKPTPQGSSSKPSPGVR
jgi:chemotaxis protein MotB